MKLKHTRDVFNFIKPYWKKGFIPVIFLVIATAISFFYPLFPKLAIDEVVMKNRSNILLPLVAAFILLVVLQRIFSYFNQLTFFKFERESILDIQQRIIDKVMNYPMEFFDKNHSGYIMGRIRGDVSGLSHIFSQALVATFLDFFKFLGALFILLTINIKLTLICIIPLPLLLIKILRSQPEIKSVNKSFIRENAIVEKELSDTFQGMGILKIHSREKDGIDRTGKSLKDFQKIQVQRKSVLLKYKNSVSLIFNIGKALLLYFGIKDVITGNFTLGSYIAFAGYMAYLYSPVQNLTQSFLQFDYAKRSYDRIKELLDILPENSGTIEIEKIDSITSRDLSFAYDDQKKLITDLNFTIKRGDRVLIRGDSGSGKSTLIKLLIGLYRPEMGEILYNDICLSELNLKVLRNRIGFISQDIFLFNKSIKENIVFSDEDVRYEDIIKVLEECRMKERVLALDKGLDHLLSEKGDNFSGGEKQRISLARALIKKPDVIILDEATTNLDNKTKEEIENIITEKFKDNIIIEISHTKTAVDGAKVLDLRTIMDFENRP